MSYVEYMNAVRLGKKEYQHAILKEKSPFLPVLDEMIKEELSKIASEMI